MCGPRFDRFKTIQKVVQNESALKSRSSAMRLVSRFLLSQTHLGHMEPKESALRLCPISYAENLKGQQRPAHLLRPQFTAFNSLKSIICTCPYRCVRKVTKDCLFFFIGLGHRQAQTQIIMWSHLFTKNMRGQQILVLCLFPNPKRTDAMRALLREQGIIVHR